MGNSIRKSPARNPPAQQRCEESEECFLALEDIITGSVSMITCEIGAETVSSNKLFRNQNKCAHPYCLDCITKYIDAKLDFGVSRIICPALNCENYLDPLSCRPFISSQVFDKWCELLCESAVLEIDRCYCPNRECSVLILNECGGRVKKSKCPKCSKLFCFACHSTWHAGYRCEEGRELRDSNDIDFGVLAENKKWQRCPACYHCVELTFGCKVVRCRCGTSFCYHCGNEAEAHWCGCNSTDCWISILACVFTVVVMVSLPTLLIYIGYKFAYAVMAVISAWIFCCSFTMGNTQQRYIENQEYLRDESVSLVTCELCTELITLPNKLFKNQNKCAHPFCEKCITMYVDSVLKCGKSQINCPALDCKHHLEPLSCRPIIPCLVFEKWCDLLCESSVLGIDMCFCPYKKCSVMILNECGGSTTKSTCPKCKRLFCYTCRVPWRAGHSCKEGRELRDRVNDIAFGVLVEKNKWQRCPACHHYVELTYGCPIVSCRCGTSFCYKCGRKVKNHLCGYCFLFRFGWLRRA